MSSFKDIQREEARRTREDMYDEAIHVAAGLASEHGENPEYDRALAELIGDLWGVEDLELDLRAAEVMQEIRRIKPISI